MKLSWKEFDASIYSKFSLITITGKCFIITKVNDNRYWLHWGYMCENYIGSFSTFRKAERIVELILAG